MNYDKVDAALAAVLATLTDVDASALTVWVELEDDANAEAGDALTRFGVLGHGRVRASRLSGREIAELSDQPWVRHLRLSTPLPLAGAP